MIVMELLTSLNWYNQDHANLKKQCTFHKYLLSTSVQSIIPNTVLCAPKRMPLRDFG